LFLDVIVEIDRNVLHQHFSGILSILKILGTLHTADHNIRNTIANSKVGSIALSLTHFLSQFCMCLFDLVCVLSVPWFLIVVLVLIL
jgi:hypothetical protein